MLDIRFTYLKIFDVTLPLSISTELSATAGFYWSATMPFMFCFYYSELFDLYFNNISFLHFLNFLQL